MGTRLARLCLDDCSARKSVPVEIVGETEKRFRVRFLEAATLPHRGPVEVGDVKWVPKHDVVSK